MITVGLDSYITLSEADELLRGDALYDKFTALTQEQQEKLLRAAAMRIDALPLLGHKKDPSQNMEFPRSYQNEVPYQVKAAQAAEAVSVLDSDAENRISMQEQGITSVTLGKVSESYGNGGRSLAVQKGLHSSAAFILLRKYIAGSCPIV